MWLLTLTRNCDKEVTNLNRRINKQPKEEKSMIGKIIDLPMEDFERELVEQKVNIGTMNNLILNLEAIYFDLRNRKDVILNSIFEGRLEKDAETEKAINGLYAEMTKLEQKIIYLKAKVKELSDVG